MGSFGERVAAAGFIPLFGDQADGPPLWPPPPRQAPADGQGEAEAGAVPDRGREQQQQHRGDARGRGREQDRSREGERERGRDRIRDERDSAEVRDRGLERGWNREGDRGAETARPREWGEAGGGGPGADAQGGFQMVHMVHPGAPELVRPMDVRSNSLRGDAPDSVMHPVHPMHQMDHPHFASAGAPVDGILGPPSAEVPAYTSVVSAAFQNLQDTAPLTTRYFAPHNQALPPQQQQQHAPDGMEANGPPQQRGEAHAISPEGGGLMVLMHDPRHPGLPPGSGGGGQGPPLRGEFIPLVQPTNVLVPRPGPAHPHVHGAPLGPRWVGGPVAGERRVLVEPGHPLFMPGERRVLVEHPSFAPGERRLVIEAGAPAAPPGAWVGVAEQPFAGEKHRRMVALEHTWQEHRHAAHPREPMAAPGQGYELREGRWGRQEHAQHREREEFRGSWAEKKEHRRNGRSSGFDRDERERGRGARLLSRDTVGRRGSEREREREREEGSLRSRGRNGRGKEAEEGSKEEESRRKRGRVEESKDSEAMKNESKAEEQKIAAGTDTAKKNKEAGKKTEATSEHKERGAGGEKDSSAAAPGTNEGGKEEAKVEAAKQASPMANGKQQNGEAPAKQEKSKNAGSKTGAADSASKSPGKPSGLAARLSRAIPGYIFGCTKRTRGECYERKLFGSQLGHLKDVERISDGTPLFLFNFDSKILEGGFVADGPGGRDFVPDAWTGSTRMRFPAQVRFSLKEPLPGLTEAEFKPAIRENFFSGAKFHMLLSEPQVNRLLDLFHAKAKTQGEADQAKKPTETPGQGKKKKVKWDDGKT